MGYVDCETMLEFKEKMLKKFKKKLEGKVIAHEYDNTLTYNKNDVIFKDESFYLCNTNIEIPEPWNTEHWDEMVYNDAVKVTPNPDISGQTTNPLTALKLGNDYYTISSSGSTVDWTDITNKPTFATVATSGSYNDLENKPNIPTVNNATLTIQKNGTTVNTFTANASSDVTANITVPIDTGDLTNGAGYITGVAWGDITGTLSNQTDLQNALNSKEPLTPNFTATSLNLSTGAIVLSIDDLEDIYTNKYDLININVEILPGLNMTFLYKRTGNTDASSPPMVRYDYTSTEENPNTHELRMFQLGFWVYYNNGGSPEYYTQGIGIRIGNDWTDITNKPNFATVATSGSYNDLINKPTIVSDVQNTSGTSFVSGGIATITGVYAHHIYIHGASDDKTHIYVTLMTDFATQFDLSSFIAYINALSAGSRISASGTIVYSVVGLTENCRGMAAIGPGTSNTTITAIYHTAGDAGVTEMQLAQGTGNTDVNTIIDTVIKIL